MGIFSGLFRSRDKPKNATTGSSYTFYLGSSSAGTTVSETTAMQMSAVYASVRVLAEAVASLPLHIYENCDEGGVKIARDHPLYRILHDEPNSEMTSFIFRETLMTHLLLWGNAFAQIVRNGKGEVIALYPLMPNRMTVDRESDGLIWYSYQHQDDEADTFGKKTAVKLRSRDVLHVPGLGFGGLVGYSPIAMAKNAIGLSIAAEEFGAKFYANGASPSGVLEHPGVLEDPAKVREEWRSQFGGSANAGKVAVLEEGMKYSPISVAPNEAQFLETRKFQIDEIARLFRVPPHMIGDLEHATFSNIEQQSTEFVRYTLDPWLKRWEQCFQRSLFSEEDKARYYVRFNVDGLLRGDYLSRMQGYNIGRQGGWMSANDIRELEDMNRIPEEEGGDLYLVNGNMAKLKDAGAAYAQSVQESSAVDPSLLIDPAAGLPVGVPGQLGTASMSPAPAGDLETKTQHA